MKAVILAGGLGTRLRPVTGEHPKPMVPMLGKPMMEHIVERLRECGYTQICAALHYRAGEIMAYFGDGRRFGVELEYRIETENLGTAGSIRNCLDFCGGEDFLIISGDAACDFELGRLMEAHKEKDAAVTIALSAESLPLRYGLAVTDGDGRIRAFIEKPEWPRVVTDLVNTGIYVLSPGALAAVPEGVCDFGKDLFPKLLKEGAPIYGLVMEGYWRDIGTPQDYYRCCADALDGKLRLTPGEAFRQAERKPAEETQEEGFTLRCDCRDRARLMGTLSELMLDLGADYEDGIRLKGKDYELHISPSAVSSSVRIAVKSEDAELARSLCLSAKEVAEKLEM
jgi:Nucleoside-diphosphate-sugar pyrophosphorylase involved in lipopolysaccharide biosynthesis/translation initiation factor 2B, gamma/epsilon subunits (eIF-2Bgamma/eIF-2Bepsilon)